MVALLCDPGRVRITRYYLSETPRVSAGGGAGVQKLVPVAGITVALGEERESECRLAFAVNDATLRQIVRREFHSDFVTRYDTDEILSHSTCYVSKDFGPGVQLDLEPCVGQGLSHRAIYL